MAKLDSSGQNCARGDRIGSIVVREERKRGRIGEEPVLKQWVTTSLDSSEQWTKQTQLRDYGVKGALHWSQVSRQRSGANLIGATTHAHSEIAMREDRHTSHPCDLSFRNFGWTPDVVIKTEVILNSMEFLTIISLHCCMSRWISKISSVQYLVLLWINHLFIRKYRRAVMHRHHRHFTAICSLCHHFPLLHYH